MQVIPLQNGRVCFEYVDFGTMVKEVTQLLTLVPTVKTEDLAKDQEHVDELRGYLQMDLEKHVKQCNVSLRTAVQKIILEDETNIIDYTLFGSITVIRDGGVEELIKTFNLSKRVSKVEKPIPPRLRLIS